MNTLVNFELAKLLKEKGFDEKCSHYYINDFQNFKHDGKLHKTGLPQDLDNENIFQYVKRTKQPHLCNAPTIAEVVMWLYEKHGIWVQGPFPLKNGKWEWVVFFLKEPLEGSDGFKNRMSIVDETPYYDTPTEAYSAAIEYTLKNLI